MSTLWGTRKRSPKTLVTQGGIASMRLVQWWITRDFTVWWGAATAPYNRPLPGAPRSLPRQGSAARRNRHQGARTGKRSFSTGVDTAVENVLRAIEGVREDVEAHPAAGDWEQFRQTLRGRVTAVTWRAWLESLVLERTEGTP